MSLRLPIPILLFAISLWLMPALAFAGVEQISEKEFRDLAAELAPKVNLFKAGWEQDPQAEFYGGTTRDYLYWLKGQFKDAKNAGDAKTVIGNLRSLPVIDVKEFIIGDSDVDVISARGTKLDAAAFGVRKIDSQSPDLLDANSEIGRNEILQGYIPAEKIRLAQDGFRDSGLGDGLNEIYSGKITVHFSPAEDFAKSKYARDGVNHPILLALRYIRNQAINYYRTYGGVLPDKERLLASIDEKYARELRRVISTSLKPGELDPYLKEKRFRSWINGSIQKSFRSYTNPTAALELMKAFQVDKLPGLHSEIEPLNQYVFSQYRDEKEIAAAFRKAEMEAKNVYQKPKAFFPDGYLYHGTRREDAFRAIQLQGILPSASGAGGTGLYGVAQANKDFSEAGTFKKDLLLRLPVDPEAKIIDTTSGPGQKLWRTSGLHYDEFARRYGADILVYEFTPQAFVVKNGAVLGKAEGVYRQVMTTNQIIEVAKKTKSPEKLWEAMEANQIPLAEGEVIWQAADFSGAERAKFIESKLSNPQFVQYRTSDRDAFATILASHYWQDEPEVQAVLARHLRQKRIGSQDFIEKVITSSTNQSPEFLAFADSLVSDPKIRKDTDLVAEILKGPLYGQPSARNGLKVVLDMLESAPRGTPSEFLQFLHKATLGSETERAWKLFQQSKPGEMKDYSADLASALMSDGKYRDEVKNRLQAELKEKMIADSQWPRIKLLAEYYPLESDSVDRFVKFTKRYFPMIADYEKIGDLKGYIAAGQKLGSPKEAKAELFDLARWANGEDNDALMVGASDAFGAMELTDKEWIEFLQEVGHENLSVETLERLSQFRPRSAKLSYEIARSWASSKSSRNTQMMISFAEVMQSDPDRSGLEAYTLEALKSDKPSRTQLDFLRALAKQEEGISLPAKKTIHEATMEFILLHAKNPEYPITGDILADLAAQTPLEDPGFSKQIQQIYKKFSGRVGDQLLPMIADRVKELDPDVRNAILRAANGIPAEVSAAVKDRAAELKKQGFSCPSRYAAFDD